MQSFHECPPQAIRDVRGVLTDIDDTLIDAQGIAEQTLAALEQLAQAGVPVIAITGRPALWSEPFVARWPVTAIVAENGAVMLRKNVNGQVQYSFAQDEATRLKNFAILQTTAQDVLAQIPQARLATDSAGRLTDIAVDHSEHQQLNELQIEHALQIMREHGLTATVSSIHINGWLGEHNKYTAAQWAVSSCLGYEFDVNEWLYVGDSTNDQLMFERIPLSIGVANIARFALQLKTLPRYVTRLERGFGFAEVAQALLAAKSSGIQTQEQAHGR